MSCKKPLKFSINQYYNSMRSITLLLVILLYVLSTSAQNVGIGIATPIQKLHVQGNVLADTLMAQKLKIASNAGLNKVLVSNATGVANWETLNFNQTSLELGSINGQTLRWSGTTWQPSINFFNTNGSIGLGISTPDSDIQIHGANPTVKRIHFTNASPGTGLLDGFIIAISGPSPDATFMQNEAQPIIFGTSGNERMRIDAAGNLGINTITPEAKLDVTGTTILGQNGTVVNAIIRSSQTIDLPSIAANGESTVSITVNNAIVGGSVYISPASSMTGIAIAYARVSAANTIEVKFSNTSLVASDPPSMAFHVTIIQ
jgi:hypothetical protein